MCRTINLIRLRRISTFVDSQPAAEKQRFLFRLRAEAVSTTSIERAGPARRGHISPKPYTSYLCLLLSTSNSWPLVADALIVTNISMTQPIMNSLKNGVSALDATSSSSMSLFTQNVESNMNNMENQSISQEGTNMIEVVPTDIQTKVDQMIKNRNYIVEKVKPLLIPDIDIYQFEGMKKPSLGKPGAEKLAAIFGLTSSFEVDTETMQVMGATSGGKQFIIYICNLYRHGQPVGQGRGATFVEYERTNYRNANTDEYNQAKARPDFNMEDWKEAKGKFEKYYKVKDGVVFDHLALNKAIKMAQKSAFVDGVIRATGMSDLFTQDIEDMEDGEGHKQEAPKEELKTTTPVQAFVQENGMNASERPCPKCGEGIMKEKNGQRGAFIGCSNYKNGCKYTENMPTETFDEHYDAMKKAHQ